MNEFLVQVQKEDVRIYDLFLVEEITDLETFLMLDNNDFSRLKLSTKMIKTIQRIQSKCADDIIIEEQTLEENNKSEIVEDYTMMAEDDISTNPNDIYNTINLDQEININTVLSKTLIGKGLIERLLEGQNPNDKMISQITHILCDCLLAVYGERPSTFHKDIIARSLVKMYPILASAASDVPHALWFHFNGRGVGRHAGKIHYRMEYYAKKSNKRIFHRRRIQPNSTDQEALSEQPDVTEVIEEDMDNLIIELKFIVPSDETKNHILNLWKKTLKIRNEHRNERTMLTFLKDFPVASAFGGVLIAYDYTTLRPNASDFNESWNDIQSKVLVRYSDTFRFIKNDFLRALAVVRQKNPTRGLKRSREQDPNLRKINPLHGIIQWINSDKSMPTSAIPQIIVVGEEFEVGECYVIWDNVVVGTGPDVLHAFVLLCKAFTVYRVACSPSDKLFFDFFYACCFKINQMSTTGNNFINFL
ncbi:uncharacterized protein LOC135699115 [Ochlerotatus camptorhynchus]|uniref:uncharacterized protein LOC135699115 n=1 Tax=Ochlerotatus camptorhynchus TaxID=644619 RepID=UPI0031D25E3F